MKAMKSDWYRTIWTLDIQKQSWVEDTRRQVDFLVEKLRLTGGERVLDLACGFGRHALELARRGFSVTGVDITPDYIRFAKEQAEKEGLAADFLCADIRELRFYQEFDAVLSMADGAVGYLESEEENRKIFAVGGYADSHFPCRLWEAGEQGLTLSEFEWDRERRVLLYGQLDFEYGAAVSRPEIAEGNPIRLYTLAEIHEILASVGMEIAGVYGDYSGKPLSDQAIQLLVCSRKKGGNGNE